jgi:hypothetical protein
MKFAFSLTIQSSRRRRGQGNMYLLDEILIKRLAAKSACNILSHNFNDKVSSKFNRKQCHKFTKLFVHNFASTLEITNYTTFM